MRTRGLRTRAAVGWVACLAVVAGCGVAPTGSATSTASAEPGAPTASDSASPTASPQPTGPVGVRFGKTYAWPDGLRVRVDEPVDYWPSGWVRTVNDFNHFRAIPVRLVNRSGARFKLDSFEVTARSGGRDADRVQDPGKLGGLPPTKVASRSAATFKVGFGVKKTTGIVVTIARGPGFREVRFSG